MSRFDREEDQRNLQTPDAEKKQPGIRAVGEVREAAATISAPVHRRKPTQDRRLSATLAVFGRCRESGTPCCEVLSFHLWQVCPNVDPPADG